MQPEFTGLRVAVLVRTHEGVDQRVKEFFNSDSFQYQLQDALAKQLKIQLADAEIDYDEVIISIDGPAERAKKVRSKSSFVGRLFGRE
jgi:hypothetical protein